MPTHVHQPPARRLNKNPPTTPDVHHRLSWPLRIFLSVAKATAWGTLCHPVIGVGKIDVDDFICFLCLWVCVRVQSLNDSVRGGVGFWGSGWVRGSCCQRKKVTVIKTMICLLGIYRGEDMCTVCEWGRCEMGSSLSQRLISKQLPLKPT